MKLWMTIIGSLAAIGTTAAWLPQVAKTWRSGKAEDFSWPYLALFSSGVTLWIAYGVLRKDAVVVAANVITVVLVVMVMFVKFREGARG